MLSTQLHMQQSPSNLYLSISKPPFLCVFELHLCDIRRPFYGTPSARTECFLSSSLLSMPIKIIPL